MTTPLPRQGQLAQFAQRVHDRRSANMTTPSVTPLVAKLAQRHRVDLATIKGSGSGGRIKPADVMAAVGLTWEPGKQPQPAVDVGFLDALKRSSAAATAPSAVEPTTSRWDSGVQVKVDPFHRNPLVEDARQASPAYALAIKESQPPTMFASGDLPLFLGSGADPSILLKIPWQARHHAANANAQDLAYLLERLGGPDGWLEAGEYMGQGAFEYDQRVQQWLRGDSNQRWV